MGLEPELVNLPDSLLRFYSNREHAEAFATLGRVRLRLLRYYRRIEDPSRNDPDEGEGRLRVPGKVPIVNVALSNGTFTDGGTIEGHFNFGMIQVQPIYLLCTCLPQVSVADMRTRFGRELVTINDPGLLAAKLSWSVGLLELGEREVLFVQGFPVRYDKDAVSELPRDHVVRAQLAYGQKPERFEAEQEYRFAIGISGPANGAPEYLDLHIADAEVFVSAARGPNG